MLLIVDNNDGICKYFNCPWDFLDASNFSLHELLEKISQYDNLSKIYLSLELKLKGKKRQHFEGLDLFKHIRLTPQLGESIQFAPILLGYTYPLEQILRNPESTILAAPSTYLFHLKNIHQINSSPFFISDENLTKGKLRPYILYTDVDEVKSEHDRRNEQGPLKLERELKGESNNDIGLDLWQKKMLFFEGDNQARSNTSTISISDFSQAIKSKRILYMDDEAEKWKKPLFKLLSGASLKIYDNYTDILDLCNSNLADKDAILKEFRFNSQLLEESMEKKDLLLQQIKRKKQDRKGVEEEIRVCKTSLDKFSVQVTEATGKTKTLLQDYYEKLAESLISDHDQVENIDNEFIDNFSILSRQLNVLKNERITKHKVQCKLFDLNKKLEEIEVDISKLSKDYAELNTEFADHSTYFNRLCNIVQCDLVILDLKLNPVTDYQSKTPSGIEILRILKNFNPHLPVVLFTSSKNPSYIEMANELNIEGYWIKNVSHADDLKNVLSSALIIDNLVTDTYWYSELIKNKPFLSKYFVSDYGKSIAKKELQHFERKVLEECLDYFIQYLKSSNKSFTEFWANTGKLSEIRFDSSKDKVGKPECNRPKLIEALALNSMEYLFNKMRNKAGAHVDKISEDFDLNIKYMNHSIEWFLNYLPLKI